MFVEADGVASVLVMPVTVIKCLGQRLTWGPRIYFSSGLQITVRGHKAVKVARTENIWSHRHSGELGEKMSYMLLVLRSLSPSRESPGFPDPRMITHGRLGLHIK